MEFVKNLRKFIKIMRRVFLHGIISAGPFLSYLNCPSACASRSPFPSSRASTPTTSSSAGSPSRVVVGGPSLSLNDVGYTEECGYCFYYTCSSASLDFLRARASVSVSLLLTGTAVARGPYFFRKIFGGTRTAVYYVLVLNVHRKKQREEEGGAVSERLDRTSRASLQPV